MGFLILVISLPIYTMSLSSFLLVAIGGWTTDSSGQPLSQHLFARFMGFALFFSNVLFSIAGIQLMTKVKKWTYFFLLGGLFSVFQFYGLLYSSHMSTYSRLTRGDSVSVVADYRRIIEKDKSEYAYRKRGEIYYGLGQYKEALADFKAINDYKFLILTYNRQKDFSSAFDALNEWQAKETNDFYRYRPCHWSGMLYFVQGKYDLALEEFKKEVELSQKYNSRVTTNQFVAIANVYTVKGGFQLASEYFDRALVSGQDFFDKYHSYGELVQALVGRGNFYQYIKQPQKAMDYYNKALEKDPKSITISNAIASLQGKLISLPSSRENRDPTKKIYDDMSFMDSIPELGNQ